MTTIRDVYDAIDRLAPFSTQMSFDNSGLLIGSPDDEVTGMIVALDATPDVLDCAVRLGCNLIVTHHPLIFNPLRSIGSSSMVYKLIRAGVGLISSHTPLDIADGGVNDWLACAIGLEGWSRTPNAELGMTGFLPQPMTAPELAKLIRSRLGSAASPVFVDGGQKLLRKVAVVGGAGGELIEELMDTDCDAIVTGEVKHHQYIMAREKGKALFAAGHNETEAVVVGPLATYLRTELPKVEIVEMTEYFTETVNI